MVKIILFLLLLSDSCFAKVCFITLHHRQTSPEGIKILINARHIVAVYRTTQYTEISTLSGSIYVVDTFQDVSKKIKACKN